MGAGATAIALGEHATEADLADARSDFLVGGRREVRGSDLLAQQFLINQAIERGFAFLGSGWIGRAPRDEGFIAHRIFPIALQNDMPVHRRDNAVENVTGPRRQNRSCKPNRGPDDDDNALNHQNVCPTLKNTLKCVACSGVKAPADPSGFCT